MPLKCSYSNSFYSLFIFFLFSLSPVLAQQNVDENDIAVSGYDVVSYFSGTPEIGNKKYKVEHQGAVYLFLNSRNKLAFEKNPEKYLPQYGGWCAYAMGDSGEKVSINPLSYTLENNKLYLFYKTTFVNTKKKWQSNNKVLKTKADKNWKKLTLKSSK